MSDIGLPGLDLPEQIMRIDRAIAESDKFHAETSRLGRDRRGRDASPSRRAFEEARQWTSPRRTGTPGIRALREPPPARPGRTSLRRASGH